MALRDILRAEAQPYLQQGERVQATFLVQTGPSPYLAALVGPLGLMGVKRYIIVSTDRAHIALTTSFGRTTKATGLAARLPRNTLIGPMSGAWAVSDLLGEPTRIHRRFHKDVEEADAQVGTPQPPASAAAPTPAGWYRDPRSPGMQRYWDGAAWTNHTAQA